MVAAKRDRTSGREMVWRKMRRSPALRALLILGLIAVASVGRVGRVPAQGETVRRVNAPRFVGEIPMAEAAVFWFGRITRTENYTDVRVGYNTDELYLRIAVVDRRIWYDTSPSPDESSAWDSVGVYLDLEGNEGGVPDPSSYLFVAQFGPPPYERYRAAYQGNGSSWSISEELVFTTSSTYRGVPGPNEDADNKGWVAWLYIPFTSLGLSSPPSEGTIWGLGVAVHDRDDAAGTPVSDETWPELMSPNRPSTWGELSFDLPVYTRPSAVLGGRMVIRQGLDGAVVVDAPVGGGTNCGGVIDYWDEWGDANYAGVAHVNIQNQADIADWPCFSKYYVTFPLDALPPGKEIISATLTLYQFGNAGGGDWDEPEPSLIQVFTVGEVWSEATLTWNNAPLAQENVSAAWVDPLADPPGFPGVPRTWDVSRAVAEAYSAAEPLRLALYSADGAYHSGKYFVGSDSGDWNAEGRPTLTVAWGEPLATIDKEVWPVVPTGGEVVTFTLSLLGNGEVLTLTDDLPAEVSGPGAIRVSGGPEAIYDATVHRLTWTGSPGVGQPVTLAFPVTVEIGGPLAVFNTAVLTDAERFVSADTAVFIVDALQVRLPLVLRGW
jgi:hypothetical protein